MPGRIDVVHGVGQEVPGGGLDKVLGELAAIGFDRTPLASGAVHPVKQDAGHAKPVLTKPGPRVAQLPPRRQSNEQAPGAVRQPDAPDSGWGSCFDGSDSCLFNVSPELHHSRIGIPPRIHNRLELPFIGPVRKLLTVCLCGCCPGRLV